MSALRGNSGDRADAGDSDIDIAKGEDTFEDSAKMRSADHWGT